MDEDTNGANNLDSANDLPSVPNSIQSDGERHSIKGNPLKKSTVKTNLVITQSAIAKALEGPANSKVLKKIQETIDAQSKTCDHFLILFKDRQQFRGLYRFDEKLQTISKLEGVGPKTIRSEDIARYFKFDYSKRQFMELQTKNIGPTTIAVSIHERFWFKHKQRVAN